MSQTVYILIWVSVLLSYETLTDQYLLSINDIKQF